ncbi:hypothetical protein OGAPHI_001881 [Ogataea philodendri]|uniref:Uncharacterized protein n=1 Tax=Ogataea philodendri TaxID=1378263 RepID=A0A9P8PB60_9ASCO|nr:uncharacterized protein OGAPHI_001881 [Ogataea philodendri]KAH3668127.1 hypothetical protein OGAPHI_001881 [Ogataea philodendri]
MIISSLYQHKLNTLDCCLCKIRSCSMTPGPPETSIITTDPSSHPTAILDWDWLAATDQITPALQSWF